MNNLYSDPLVSVIIPVYNGSNYMCEAIDSALNQTYSNIEVIVINDGSTDNGATEEIAMSYGDKIRYIKKENGGVSSALNLGIKEMHGEYFSWLSHDDVYTPNKVECQIQLLKEIEYANVIVMCATQQIDKNSVPMGAPLKIQLPVRKVIEWQQALLHIIDHSCNGCALLIPKKAFESCGTFDETLRYSQDFLMWMRFFMSGFSLLVHDEVCVLSRVHSQQVTQTRRDLFEHDSKIVAELLVPQLTDVSTPNNNFLYRFATTNAVHSCKAAVKTCIKYGQEKHIISLEKRLKLRIFVVYGQIRPLIRKLYYMLFKH